MISVMFLIALNSKPTVDVSPFTTQELCKVAAKSSDNSELFTKRCLGEINVVDEPQWVYD